MAYAKRTWSSISRRFSSSSDQLPTSGTSHIGNHGLMPSRRATQSLRLRASRSPSEGQPEYAEALIATYFMDEAVLYKYLGEDLGLREFTIEVGFSDPTLSTIANLIPGNWRQIRRQNPKKTRTRTVLPEIRPCLSAKVFVGRARRS
jgi:hypothetical protein